MYSRVPPPLTGAWASSCLCASFRAFRFARPYLGGQQSHFSPLTAPGAAGKGSWFLPASFCQTINSKRKREATALLSWRPLHNRPAGVVWQVPGFVGNPATDIVSKINPSTTLFQKFGVLRGFAPKCPFAYFSGMGKVGPRRVGTLRHRQDCRNLHATTAKGGRAGARNFPAPIKLPEKQQPPEGLPPGAFALDEAVRFSWPWSRSRGSGTRAAPGP